MPIKHRPAVLGIAAGLVGGGLAGLVLGISGFAGAADAGSTSSTTAPPATASAPGSSTAPSATATGSNEDPTHEAGESAEREALEDSGQAHFRGGPGGRGSNEDPAHEAGESAEREAQEHATAPSSTTPTTTNNSI